MKTVNRLRGVVAATVVLMGCATKAYEGEPRSASELTVALAVQHSDPFNRLFIKTSTPADASGEFRHVFGYWWCAPDHAASMVSTTRDNYASLCKRLGGAWQEPYCVSPIDRDRVLFVARITAAHQKYCANGAKAEVFEPTGDPMAPMYVRGLRAMGFRTSADLANAVREREAAARIVADVERRAAMLLVMRQRGTRVCRAAEGNMWVGFVEDSTNSDLKIRVVNAFRIDSPQSQIGGFRPNVTWDSADRWKLCD